MSIGYWALGIGHCPLVIGRSHLSTAAIIATICRLASALASLPLHTHAAYSPSWGEVIRRSPTKRENIYLVRYF
ncbi:MAG: hypothetical protein ICV54_26655 [Nostoc sp. C3-bin3]|nr:hypothetical protein [Nostoc sp. C3-bin3]